MRTPLLLLLNDQLGFYYCLALINTALGLSVHSFFFVPLLLDIVVQSRLLQKVTEALTLPLPVTLTLALALAPTPALTLSPYPGAGARPDQGEDARAARAAQGMGRYGRYKGDLGEI